VQQCRDQGDGVHPEIGEDLGDRQRVGDVGVAALAHLTAVHPFGGHVCPAQHPDVAMRVDLAVGT
jgi:hypothetical protein